HDGEGADAVVHELADGLGVFQGRAIGPYALGELRHADEDREAENPDAVPPRELPRLGARGRSPDRRGGVVGGGVAGGGGGGGGERAPRFEAARPPPPRDHLLTAPPPP